MAPAPPYAVFSALSPELSLVPSDDVHYGQPTTPVRAEVQAPLRSAAFLAFPRPALEYTSQPARPRILGLDVDLLLHRPRLDGAYQAPTMDDPCLAAVDERMALAQQNR